MAQQQPLVIQGFLIIRAPRSHSPHLVELLSTSYQPNADTST